MIQDQNIMALCEYRFQQANESFMPSEEQCREAVNQSKDFVKEMRHYFENLKTTR